MLAPNRGVEAGASVFFSTAPKIGVSLGVSFEAPNRGVDDAAGVMLVADPRPPKRGLATVDSVALVS